MKSQIENLVSIGCSYMTTYFSDPPNHTGTEVAQSLGLKHIDGWSRCGASNDEIIAKAQMFFLKDRERVRDTFALIGMTESQRVGTMENWFIHWPDLCIWDKDWFSEQGDEKELSLKTPEDGSYKNEQSVGWTTHTNKMKSGDLAFRAIRQALELQNFFKFMGIKYCIYHGVRPWPIYERAKPHGLKYLVDSIDETCFYLPFKYSHCRKIHDEEGLIHKGHPNFEGHKVWSKEITSFIEKNELLK